MLYHVHRPDPIVRIPLAVAATGSLESVALISATETIADADDECMQDVGHRTNRRAAPHERRAGT